MPRKLLITYVVEAAACAAILFGAAGTLAWPAGWGFMALFFGATLPMGLRLAREDPALLAERMRSPIQPGQPAWDRVILSLLVSAMLVWLVLMPLDAVRFGWSAMPAWLQWVGGAGLLLSLWMMDRAFRANTFLAPVVRIQAERGHRVITTGPYAIVRHPMYSGALVMFFSTALLLGSWWGVAGAAVLSMLLVARTVMEDRELHLRLAGYPDYARRVRWRLVPHVW
jgi:protein-S-isoprenylcysteine O-methyltransferase Ste14